MITPLIIRTTMHPFERKRNKKHKFIALFTADPDKHERTGRTLCGRTTYVNLRTSRPRDTECKICFRLTKPNVPVIVSAESSTANAGVKTAKS